MLDTRLTDEQQSLRKTVEEFAREVVAPVSYHHDRTKTFPYDVVRQMGEMGLFGLPFPEEFGGMGGDYFALCLVLEELARVAYFPIAVMAITSERLYLVLTERGPRAGMIDYGGTLLVVLACYLVMNSTAMQVLVSGFPEVLLLVIAANIYLGRWVGVRLIELWRFRRLWRGEEPRT